MALSQGSKRIRTALGLHPEIAHERQSELALFDELLPEAKYVGEIGLDRTIGTEARWPAQALVFRHILTSCQRIGGRVMSIHSRRATDAYAHLAESFFHQSMDEFRKLARAEATAHNDVVAAKAEETRQRTLLLDERERELSEAIADRDLRIAALETALAERADLLVVARHEQQALLRRIGRLTREIRRSNERLHISDMPKRLMPPRVVRARKSSANARRSRCVPRSTRPSKQPRRKRH